MEKIKFNYFFHNEGRVRYESLDDIVAMVRNEKYVTIVKKMREKVTAAVAMSMNDRINSGLNIPSVCLSEGECGYSGLLTLSLPMNDDIERLVEVRRMLVQLPQVVCLFTGVSGRSLKVVMRYCVMGGGELPDDTNTICLSAQMAGIEAWDNDILRYVNSAVIDDYDPIAQWIYDLPHWDGRDRVAELAAMVKTDYQAWDHDLRIWLRSMVSQWMQRGGLYGSCIVLMLAGGQGTGKSTFFKRLLPSELLTYYNDRIDFANKREAERALMRFVLICMDEFDQITKSQTAYLKHIIQKSDIKWRKMYKDEITQRHRYAAFCATTNSMMPLTDPSGSRRYLCVNVIGRIDTVTEIDHKQLYAQIVHEIRSGAVNLK